MCDYWLHKQPKENKDRKWSEVYEALEQQGNRRLKAKLEKKYVADTTGNILSHCVLSKISQCSSAKFE